MMKRRATGAGAAWLRHALVNAGVALGALLITFVALEIACRLAVRVGWLRPSLRGHVVPDIAYSPRLVRSADETLYLEFDPTDPLVNRSGLRGPLLPEPKPPNTFRILVLGDSVAFGLGVPYEDTFVARLSERLAAAAGPGDPRYEVLDFAVSGYGTQQELRLLETRGLAYEPDLVLLTYVINDPIGPSILGMAMADMSKETQRPLNIVASYSELVGLVVDRLGVLGLSTRARTNYHKVYNEPAAWGTVVAGIAELARSARDHGFRTAVVMFPLLYDLDDYEFAQYHDRVQATVADAGLPFLDLRSVLPERDLTGYRVHPLDDTHPNAGGHAAAAVAIERFLRERGLLEPGPAGSTRP